MLRMAIFTAVYLTVYSGMHLLVRWGVQPLLHGHPVAGRWLTAWMLLMIPVPMLIRVLENAGWEMAARATAVVGYLWMGLVFLAFAGFALVAGGELLLRLGARFVPLLSGGQLVGTVSALLVVGASLTATLYGLGEARSLRVERVELQSDRLPAGMQRLRIVQISDLHLGLLLRERALARVMDLVEPLQPDLLVVTGDLVDAQLDHLDGLGVRLAAFQPPLGKFAVTGNHEYYAGFKQAVGFMGSCGLQVLRNQQVRLLPGLLIAGVDDPTGGAVDERAVLDGSAAALTILLKHRPLLDPATTGLFDLQLSGHAHRGQIFPFNLLTGLAFPLQDGLTVLPQRGWLYCSRGTGTWGPPLRVGSPPEITLIEITRPK